MKNLVIMKDRKAVTSSLNVAENFEKEHRVVLKAIDDLKEGLAQKYADLFWEDTYIHPQNKQPYRVVYMNRDGFTLAVLGFNNTKRVLQFKLKYIEAFNQMEQHIKEQLDTSNLSPELQFMNSVVQSLAKQEQETKRIENKVDSITEIVALNSTDWRKDSRTLISKMAKAQGGYEAYREVQADIYQELDRRAGSSLKTRVTNKRRRMADEGVSKSKRDKLSKLDVIAEDKRLLEIYLAIVKEFAVKYGVWDNEF
ncbi:Rha family transcriptional regulator [Enterococcus hulanensis]|uniref:Rha family transcriptional regulator n=1 Tax=Enterococcus hulanensis TaxID=2559929 RepID=A0ABU3EZS9_9ENTE|nr:Rha family transcriptional regulator [Enterococcus hulanensis]MDT2600398.1 Rha family transcriptional regulator [Enterococcus hulanensis]MDT2609864.1 Rha family transcriptional regulator [Enterococcus hulanensis]MDT2617508.1 Rha family transcriptional regulator [Enterococcus hulanensis]MDT2628733.1 Rha family transcriptional regulator [Enterococcus hulanensis]MDT2656073.1 Rha family transcriptional regulator [Enterococcus hulanensis]